MRPIPSRVPLAASARSPRPLARPFAAAALVLALLPAVASCSSSGGGGADASACAGTDRSGAVHVLQGGTYPLAGGARAGINVIGDDHAATLTLLGGRPGDPATVDVKVGDEFGVAGHRFQVVQVCSDKVSLLPSS
ncbi:hypothetical protein [Microbispora sp. ATCC PTA-5024]|uniref:hypothetical protein n=1 Tax=Microbispora sp. ATCC PTA-5024 TaxID=316330 RepID=UPI0003DC68A1|nr:hypothetical protein [Microbispora sp. ATCC PTA-5024]ETK32704.1 hypothetical protein MPTA5024_28290 [Microbispora sp. ATCC PTA-5024]